MLLVSNVFTNKLDNGSEWTLSKFAYDNKLAGGELSIVEGRAVIQRAGQAEEMDKHKFHEVQHRQWKVLPLVRKNVTCLYRLAAGHLESSIAEKDLGILVDNKLNMSQ